MDELIRGSLNTTDGRSANIVTEASGSYGSVMGEKIYAKKRLKAVLVQ